MAKIEMPKNAAGNPEVDVIAEDITTALARIDWLLNGNVDVDNMAHKESGTAERKLLIPASKVQDIPLISNEIQSFKFFRDQDGVSFKAVWDSLATAAKLSPNMTVVTGDASIIITKGTEFKATSVILTEEIPEYGQTGKATFIASKQFIVEIEIPSGYVPISHERAFEIMGIDYEFGNFNTKETVDNFAANIDFYIDSNFGNGYLKRNLMLSSLKGSYSTKSRIFSLEFIPTIDLGNDAVFDETSFANISISASVLCEERV